MDDRHLMIAASRTLRTSVNPAALRRLMLMKLPSKSPVQVMDCRVVHCFQIDDVNSRRARKLRWSWALGAIRALDVLAC